MDKPIELLRVEDGTFPNLVGVEKLGQRTDAVGKSGSDPVPAIWPSLAGFDTEL